MPDEYDELENWIKTKRESKAQQLSHEETNARFDRIEAGLGSLAESVKTFLDRSSPAEPPGTGSEGEGAATTDGKGSRPSPKKTEEPPPDIPVQRVQRMDVPRIYTGDDEPETVTYIDANTGEEKTRTGRQKGKPTPWNIEDVPDGEEEGNSNAA